LHETTETRHRTGKVRHGPGQSPLSAASGFDSRRAFPSLSRSAVRQDGSSEKQQQTGVVGGGRASLASAAGRRSRVTWSKP
jgi:hypothetical protein